MSLCDITSFSFVHLHSETADDDRSKWRSANKLKCGGKQLLTEEMLKEMQEQPTPGRAGVTNWRGNYLVQEFDFDESQMGRQELKVYAAQIWSGKGEKEGSTGSLTLVQSTGLFVYLYLIIFKYTVLVLCYVSHACTVHL